MLLHPDLTLRCGLLFPYRGDAFQLINTPLTGLKGIRPVSRSYYNEHYILTNANLTDPVNDIHFFDVKILKGLSPYLVELLLCHSGIVLKIKLLDGPAAGCPSPNTKKYNNAADIPRTCLNPVNLLIYRK